jgi:cellulose synthase/poly-beta-1,6-N-acetylglucosamine synthase-like glycosyltransferase
MSAQQDILHRIGLVIFARDESSIINETIRTAKKALGSQDALLVVADHCVDGTEAIAREAGAQVFIHNAGSPNGKGAALVWFAQSYPEVLKQFTRLVILDADSGISPDFLVRLKTHLHQNEPVSQCFICPVGYEQSPISTLIALSELVEQSVFNRIRSFLGCSIRLRGTGMVFDPAVFLSVCNNVQTEVEDIVLSLLVAEKKLKVKQMDGVMVYDPKPTETAAASRQRARWFRGQWAAFCLYRSSVFKVLAQGPRGWVLLSALFLKPRWLMMACKAALALLCYRWPVMASLWGISFLLDCLLILVGVFGLKDKKTFLKAMLHIPGFVWMWLRSIVLSFHRLPWLRVRGSVEYQESGGLSPIPFMEVNQGKLKPPEPI